MKSRAVIKLDEKRFFQVCGGLDKREVFQKAIMPVLKTMGQSEQAVREIITKIIEVVIDNNPVIQPVAQIQ